MGKTDVDEQEYSDVEDELVAESWPEGYNLMLWNCQHLANAVLGE